MPAPYEPTVGFFQSLIWMFRGIGMVFDWFANWHLTIGDWSLNLGGLLSVSAILGLVAFVAVLHVMHLVSPAG